MSRSSIKTYMLMLYMKRTNLYTVLSTTCMTQKPPTHQHQRRHQKDQSQDQLKDSLQKKNSNTASQPPTFGRGKLDPRGADNSNYRRQEAAEHKKRLKETEKD